VTTSVPTPKSVVIWAMPLEYMVAATEMHRSEREEANVRLIERGRVSGFGQQAENSGL
jgi:hypothetical protein